MINFEEIRDIMEAAREEHFTSKGIETCEGIYYMNGLNGTDYDYFENNHICPFALFKPESNGEPGYYYIQLFAFRNNKYKMIIFKNPPHGEILEINGELKLSVYSLVSHLQEEKDNKGIWNELVTSWELENETFIENYRDGLEDDED